MLDVKEHPIHLSSPLHFSRKIETDCFSGDAFAEESEKAKVIQHLTAF